LKDALKIPVSLKRNEAEITKQALNLIQRVQESIDDKPLQVAVQLVSSYASRGNQKMLQELQDKISTATGGAINDDIQKLINRMNKQIDNAMIFNVKIQTDSAWNATQAFVKKAKDALKTLQERCHIYPDVEISEDAEKKFREQLEKIRGEEFKINIGFVDGNGDLSESATKNELLYIESLRKKIKEVETAIGNKNKAFLAEEEVVDKVVISEIIKLSDLENKMSSIQAKVQYIAYAFGTIPEKFSLEFDDGLIKSLEELSKTDVVKSLASVRKLIHDAIGDDLSETIEISPSTQKKIMDSIRSLQNEIDKVFKIQPIDTWADHFISRLEEMSSKFNGIFKSNKGGITQSIANIFDDWKFSDDLYLKSGKKVNERAMVIGSDKKIYGYSTEDTESSTRYGQYIIDQITKAGIKALAQIHSHATDNIAASSLPQITKDGKAIGGDLVSRYTKYKNNGVTSFATAARKTVEIFDAKSFFDQEGNNKIDWNSSEIKSKIRETNQKIKTEISQNLYKYFEGFLQSINEVSHSKELMGGFIDAQSGNSVLGKEFSKKIKEVANPEDFYKTFFNELANGSDLSKALETSAKNMFDSISASEIGYTEQQYKLLVKSFMSDINNQTEKILKDVFNLHDYSFIKSGDVKSSRDLFVSALNQTRDRVMDEALDGTSYVKGSYGKSLQFMSRDAFRKSNFMGLDEDTLSDATEGADRLTKSLENISNALDEIKIKGIGINDESISKLSDAIDKLVSNINLISPAIKTIENANPAAKIKSEIADVTAELEKTKHELELLKSSEESIDFNEGDISNTPIKSSEDTVKDEIIKIESSGETLKERLISSFKQCIALISEANTECEFLLGEKGITELSKSITANNTGNVLGKMLFDTIHDGIFAYFHSHVNQIYNIFSAPGGGNMSGDFANYYSDQGFFENGIKTQGLISGNRIRIIDFNQLSQEVLNTFISSWIILRRSILQEQRSQMKGNVTERELLDAASPKLEKEFDLLAANYNIPQKIFNINDIIGVANYLEEIHNLTNNTLSPLEKLLIYLEKIYHINSKSFFNESELSDFNNKLFTTVDILNKIENIIETKGNSFQTTKSIKEDEILSQLLLEVEELYGQGYKNNVAIRNNTRDDGAGSRTMPESPRVEPRLSEGRYRQSTGNNDELPNASGSNISLIDDITDSIEEEAESLEAETKAEKSNTQAIIEKRQELEQLEKWIQRINAELKILKRSNESDFGLNALQQSGRFKGSPLFKDITAQKDKLANTLFNGDKTIRLKGAGSYDRFMAYKEELSKAGYTLSDITSDKNWLSAKIIPINQNAIDNIGDFRKALDSTSVSSEELEQRIISLSDKLELHKVKAETLTEEIKELESEQRKIVHNESKSKKTNSPEKSTEKSIVKKTVPEKTNEPEWKQAWATIKTDAGAINLQALDAFVKKYAIERNRTSEDIERFITAMNLSEKEANILRGSFQRQSTPNIPIEEENKSKRIQELESKISSLTSRLDELKVKEKELSNETITNPKEEENVNSIVDAISRLIELISRGFNIPTFEELNTQLDIVKTKLNALDVAQRGKNKGGIKLTGQTAALKDFAVEYQKYLDMGGDNSKLFGNDLKLMQSASTVLERYAKTSSNAIAEEGDAARQAGVSIEEAARLKELFNQSNAKLNAGAEESAGSIELEGKSANNLINDFDSFTHGLSNAIEKIITSGESTKEVTNFLKQLKNTLNVFSDDTAGEKIRKLNDNLNSLQDTLNHLSINSGGFLSEIKEILSASDELSHLLDIIKNYKKVSSIKKDLSKDDKTQIAAQNMARYSQDIQNNLNDMIDYKGGILLSSQFTAMSDGLIRVSALIKDINNEYKELIYTTEKGASGTFNLLSERSGTSVYKKGIKAEKSILDSSMRSEYTSIADYLNKNGISDIGTFSPDDADKAQWQALIDLITKFGVEVENISKIIRRTDGVFESFEIFNKQGHSTTLGMSSDMILKSEQELVNVKGDIETIDGLLTKVKSSWKKTFDGSDLSNIDFQSSINQINELYNKLITLSNTNLGLISDDEINNIGIKYDAMLSDLSQSINKAFSPPKNSRFTDEFNERIKIAKDNANQLMQILSDGRLGLTEDQISKIDALRRSISETYSKLKDDSNISASNSSIPNNNLKFRISLNANIFTCFSLSKSILLQSSISGIGTYLRSLISGIYSCE